MTTVRVISLQRSAQRRRTFAQRNAHLDHAFFDAVDGAALTDVQRTRPDVFGTGLDYTLGARGCALSHLALWDQCIASGQPLTIAEDDAVFRHDFASQQARALASLPDDWDFVLWGWNFDFLLQLRFMAGVSPAVVRFDQAQMRAGLERFQAQRDAPHLMRLDKVWGIPAYTLSPKGARLFRERCVPLRPVEISVLSHPGILGNTGIDSPMNLVYPDSQSYVAFPPLVLTPNEHATSTIQIPRFRGPLSRAARKLKLAWRSRPA